MANKRASPNGGPPKSSGNSEVSAGPPSVSYMLGKTTRIMKRFLLITLATLIAASSATRTCAQETNGPLSLFINGGGSVSPLTNGELLQVGQSYNMVATPLAGFVFNSWQPVNVFTLTSIIIETISGGVITNTNVSVIVSPLPTYTNEPSLSFIMQPVDVLYNTNGSTLTLGRGWQANFGPVALSIQASGSAVILIWTNASFSLQTAPTPSGVYTNIPGAISPYTNNISAPAQCFRLVSD